METPVTLACIERYLDSLRDQGRSSNTIRAYQSDLLNFLTTTQSTLTLESLDQQSTFWLNAGRASWSPKTTGRRLTSLRGLARFLGAASTRLDGYHAPTPARPVPHPLPEGVEGVSLMLGVVKSERQRALIGLCGLAGLRCSEALSVAPHHFNTVDMTLTVMGKGDKQRVVPVTQHLWSVVAPAVRTAVLQGRVTVVGYRDRFARQVIMHAGESAGLRRRVSSHDLRATFLTAAYNLSLDLRAVQELAGHSSSSTTEVYTQVRMDTMRRAAEVMP